MSAAVLIQVTASPSLSSYVDAAARCSEQSRRKAVTQSHGATAAHRQARRAASDRHGSSVGGPTGFATAGGIPDGLFAPASTEGYRARGAHGRRGDRGLRARHHADRAAGLRRVGRRHARHDHRPGRSNRAAQCQAQGRQRDFPLRSHGDVDEQQHLGRHREPDGSRGGRGGGVGHDHRDE